MGDEIVEEEDAAEGHLACDHVSRHVNAQLALSILLVHLHIPAHSHQLDLNCKA